MRTALVRDPRLSSFETGYARKVRCNGRVSKLRRRCKMRWNIGDLSFSGRGLIWLTRDGDWHYSYRVRKRNAYCQATGGSNCVETITGR